MKESFFVSVRNYRWRLEPIIVFEGDDEEKAYNAYWLLRSRWENESYRDDEYMDSGERNDEWWDDAPMLVRRTGDLDYPEEVLEEATDM